MRCEIFSFAGQAIGGENTATFDEALALDCLPVITMTRRAGEVERRTPTGASLIPIGPWSCFASCSRRLKTWRSTVMIERGDICRYLWSELQDDLG